MPEPHPSQTLSAGECRRAGERAQSADALCNSEPDDSTARRAGFEHYAQARARHSPPGYRIEVLAHLSRLIPLAPQSEAQVMFARLPAARADATIGAEIAHFAALGQAFEWKWHAFDEPADLPLRLQRRGFERDEAEALLVLRSDSPAAAALAAAASAGPATIRRVGPDIDVAEGVRAAAGLQERVWGRRFPWLEADLLAAFADPATAIELFLAVAGDTTIGSGWMVGPAGATSADLHGGALLPAWRGRGIYSALLRARLRAARDRGVQSLYVDAAPLSRPILERKGFRFICETVPYHLSPDPGQTGSDQSLRVFRA